ncbi:MAG: type II toxin-antitoxin system HicB family antitoxin [Chloroflexi bacterium]|nr:type II toxin-antitoxin system HicB family antitoxin [Chloroflexota bacterium]
MADYQFTVVIERDEDGMYVVSVPALPGCHTQGGSREEALENIREAIRLYIDALRDLGEPIPVEVGLEKVRVVA